MATPAALSAYSSAVPSLFLERNNVIQCKQKIQEALVYSRFDSTVSENFPGHCVQLVIDYLHPANAQQAMKLALEESENLSLCYREREVDSEYIERFTQILQIVEKANVTEPAPREIWVKLVDFQFKKLEIFNPLLEPICKHQSSINKLIAKSFFDVFSERLLNRDLYVEFYRCANNGMFSEEGVKKLLELNCSQTNIVSGDTKEILEKIQEMISKGSTSTCAMILTENFSFHLTPLFVRYANSQLDIVITDSMKMKFDMQEPTRKPNNEVFLAFDAFFAKNGMAANLYVFDTPRLYHTDTCGMFVIQDIEHFFHLEKRGSSLFEIAKRYAQSPHTYTSAMNVYPFDYLPVPMMKYTQSTTVVNNYLSKYPNARQESTSIHSHEPLEETIARYSVTVTYESKRRGCEVTAKVNNYAATMFIQYLKQLFLHFYSLSEANMRPCKKHKTDG